MAFGVRVLLGGEDVGDKGSARLWGQPDAEERGEG